VPARTADAIVGTDVEVPAVSRFICTAIGECPSAGFRAALAALLVLAVLVEAAIAGPLENAAAAFQCGDYATTRRIMQSLAEQGDPSLRWNASPASRSWDDAGD
jgi:hypothetical protein